MIANRTKTCPWCKKDFEFKSNKAKWCSRKCKNELNNSLNRALGKRYVTKIEIWNKALAMLTAFKKQKFFLREIDIFVLIDVYDTVFPNKHLKLFGDNKKLYETMILEIMEWCRENKKYKDLSVSEMDRG